MGSQPQHMLTLKIGIDEMSAVHEVITTYIAYLDANVADTEARAHVLNTLRQLQLRLYNLSVCRDGFFIAPILIDESVVLGQSVIIYQEILRTRPSLLPRGEREPQQTLQLVMAMQKRFLESQRQSHKPLH